MNCRRTLISSDLDLAESLGTKFETPGMKWKGPKGLCFKKKSEKTQL